MKKAAFAYWSCVIVTGIIAGVFVARLDKNDTITGKPASRNIMSLQQPVNEAIECSKDMGKAAILTQKPDSNSRGFSLPRKPHN